jgi:hypothetical protein
LGLSRAQLIAGNDDQGIVLSGQVRGVTAGIGVTISPQGVLSINASDPSFNGFIKTNNNAAYNAYEWPTLGGAPAFGSILQSDGTGKIGWVLDYVRTTSPTGAANLPSGTTGDRPTGVTLATGQIRFNSTEGVLEYYDGLGWIPVLGLDPTPGPTQTIGLGLTVSGVSIKVSVPIQFGPPDPGSASDEAVNGSLYWDDNLGLMFIRYFDGISTQWVQVVPSP